MADKRPRAVLDTDPRTEADHLGYLRFEAPDGGVDVIEVTDGPSFERFPEKPVYHRGPVWHIDIHDGQVAVGAPAGGLPMTGGIILVRNANTPQERSVVVRPSIDIKDRYHTPGTVVFDLVDAL